LPLYPDDADIVFNENFLTSLPNILADLVPVYGHLADVIRIIDIPASTDGQFLQIMMNADQGRAVAILSESHSDIESGTKNLAVGRPTAIRSH
jgi:hypothetical protein